MEEARAILAAQVSRDDAVFDVAHGAALIAAVMRSDGALLALAMADRLHQPARTKLVPALSEIIGAAREAGAFGAAPVGGGPGVLPGAPPPPPPPLVSAAGKGAPVPRLPRP